ncbi:MAG: CopD family protein [Pararhodobacter sp.]|nr:CopD family protein [Pararhodobacter sp.]
MIAALKAVHIASLAVWCAGLVALPLLMQIYGRRELLQTQAGYAEFRLLSHRAYTRLVTPAAIIAVAAGTVLLLALDVLNAWMMAKLVAVSGMVLVHAWLGNLIGRSREERGDYRLPLPILALPLALAFMASVLWLVLAKPDLSPLIDSLPEVMRSPQERDLPPGLVPI